MKPTILLPSVTYLLYKLTLDEMVELMFVTLINLIYCQYPTNRFLLESSSRPNAMHYQSTSITVDSLTMIGISLCTITRYIGESVTLF
jgi:hypothetical protein